MSKYHLAEFPFTGKVVSVTGSGSGIGLDTTLLLYARGASVAASDFNQDSLKKTAKLLSEMPARDGQRFTTTLVDVSKSDQVNAWMKSIVDHFGRLDLAANVAGAGDRVVNLEERTDAEFDFSTNVNLRGCFNCMRAQIPLLPKGGAIVNVSSGSGIQGTPGNSIYSAAKAGVNSMTSAAAKENGAKGIRINAISPGVTLTPAMVEGPGKPYLEWALETTPLKRGADPVEQAKGIAFLLSEEASFISGVVLRVDGAFAAVGY